MTPTTGSIPALNVNESAFWRFSLKLYSQTDIPPICLHLQDQYGVDVNVLFFCLFLSVQQRLLESHTLNAIEKKAKIWRSNVVEPLRSVRKILKTDLSTPNIPGCQKLREAIKKSELAAERLQQEMLEESFPIHHLLQANCIEIAMKHNLALYDKAIGPLPKPSLQTLTHIVLTIFLSPT
jgi:uncharacterized protein (TIGR02444 family)